jgi:hypothetical protein
MRHTAGYMLLSHLRNQDNLEELKIDPAELKLIKYKKKNLNYVSRM